LTEPPQDDRNVVNRWSKLAEDMALIWWSALRAGHASRHQGKDDILAPGFRISGLGQLVEAGIQCDRLVTFGD
jgi:tRNA 2-thiouridine synthesizing protein D